MAQSFWILVKLWKCNLQYITDAFNLHNVKCHYCKKKVPNDLNAPFTIEEVINNISKLPNGKFKAASHDGLVYEMLKCSHSVMVPYLVVLFNKILDSGRFPESWCKSIIQQLLKKGDPENVKNYRVEMNDVCHEVHV